MDLRYFGHTDAGLQRSKNEDAYLVDDERGLFAVADGLGGLPKGEVASRVTVDALAKQMPTHLTEESAWRLCNHLSRHVRSEGLRIAGTDSIATTLTLAQVRNEQLQIVHVGDSAGFLLSGGEPRRLTRDHTIAERMRENGAATVSDYYEHVLTQCIGQVDDINPDFIEVALSVGDRILLCTDGLTKTLSDEEIFDLLETSAEPEQLTRRLVAEANDRGGPDNSTAVAVFC